MHPAEITNYLDDAISELAKNRLPDEPGYPSGEIQYASFMMRKEDEMNSQDRQDRKLGAEHKLAKYKGGRVNGNWTGDASKAVVAQGSLKNG